MSQDQSPNSEAVSPGLLSRAWSRVKAGASWLFRLFLRYPLAFVASAVLLLVAGLALTSGRKLQIGGLLGQLWGSKKPERARGVPPEDRVTEGGRPILPGESDEKGWVQAPVSTSIIEPGVFSDPSEIEISHPEKGRVVVELPEGVKNTDVREVVEVRPDVYEVRNLDKGLKPKQIDDVLKKLDG